MGASTVLLFAVPASPLAQPWSILGGNTIAALIGVGVRMLVPDPMLASAMAGATAILAMLVLRCLHPPSGARVALTGGSRRPAVFDSASASPCGRSRRTRRSSSSQRSPTTTYRPRLSAPCAAPGPDHATQDPPPNERIVLSAADLDAALAEADQLSTSRAPTSKRFLAAHGAAFLRTAGAGDGAADIMSRDVVSHLARRLVPRGARSPAAAITSRRCR